MLREHLYPNTIWPYSDYLYSSEHCFIYCPIPKVACTSLKRWFLATLGDTNTDFPGGVHSYARQRSSLSTVPARDARRMLRTYPRLAVVRNPWHRTASGFLDKFVREPLNVHNIRVIEEIHRRRGKSIELSREVLWPTSKTRVPLKIDPSIPYHEGISFTEFVDYLFSSTDDELDVHWKPQTAFSGSRPFDIVIRLENLAEGLASFEQMLCIDHFPVPHLNRTTPNQTADASLLADVPAGQLRERHGDIEALQLYTPELIRMVGERFANDIRTFDFEATEDLAR